MFKVNIQRLLISYMLAAGILLSFSKIGVYTFEASDFTTVDIDHVVTTGVNKLMKITYKSGTEKSYIGSLGEAVEEYELVRVRDNLAVSGQSCYEYIERTPYVTTSLLFKEKAGPTFAPIIPSELRKCSEQISQAAKQYEISEYEKSTPIGLKVRFGNNVVEGPSFWVIIALLIKNITPIVIAWMLIKNGITEAIIEAMASLFKSIR